MVFLFRGVATMSIYEMAAVLLSVSNKTGAEGDATMVVRWVELRTGGKH